VATKQLGNLTEVEFNTTDISGTYTTFEISGEAPEKEQVDVSDKSSWAAGEIETIDGLAGQPKTTVTVTINDEAGGASNAYTLAENDTGTLVIYPEGKTHGKPARTLSNATLQSRKQSGGYQSKIEWTLTFYAYEAIVESTYSTAM